MVQTLETQTEQQEEFMPEVRTRRRALNVETEVAPVALSDATIEANDQNLASFLSDFAQKNYASNSWARQATSAKKALHLAMIAEGVTEFRTMVQLPDKVAEFEAVIDAPDKEVISVETLRELVDDETFMKIVKATKTDVTKFGGSNIVLRATVVEKDKEDLRVKEVKS